MQPYALNRRLAVFPISLVFPVFLVFLVFPVFLVLWVFSRRVHAGQSSTGTPVFSSLIYER
ncbi:hypothetical protein ADL28_16650 [Streptomyces violaceusniger]|uniref:Uncharacterized protein n=1 Tax=Streptomyces violaceusniger TaxID=68280 RepID=A0A0X3WUT2_STRVO|nr:hypothetical protein ADL28_16650 [Streptomyces violaceusniger]